ncbi:hypothetical protein [Polaromonas sp.]|uniref:hypothetical protein n=1 Tax=Polaromonas sp. TaxID=1869339 RepID=UPI003267D8C0
MTTPIEIHLEAFFTSAEAIIDDGLHHARQDDPHRFHTVGREFDGGKARRQLTVDYLPEGRMRLALVFIGTRAGEDRAVEMFATTVQGPQPGALQ